MGLVYICWQSATQSFFPTAGEARAHRSPSPIVGLHRPCSRIWSSLSKGIRISIPDLNGFVQVLEEAFLRDENLSALIGRLANFDIRRMMLLGQRTICSPSFRVEDLVRAFVAQRNQAFDPRRATRALILGEYDRHVDQSSDFVTNVFHTEGSRPYSPLLLLSVLELLAGAKNTAGSNSDDSYMSVTDLMSYFEPCQVEADDLREVTKILLKRRLVEPLEPDRDDFNDGMRIALTPAGEAHQEMAYGDVVYAEQMAMTTGVRLDALRVRLSVHTSNMAERSARDALVKEFMEYVVNEDSRKVFIPPAANYASQRKLRAELLGRRT